MSALFSIFETVFVTLASAFGVSAMMPGVAEIAAGQRAALEAQVAARRRMSAQ